MSIVLYAAPMSSATPVVHAFAELDVPHERIMFDLSAGEQRKPAFLALNPNGKVPTLVVDGTPMFEGLAIIQFLGDRFGVQRGLWPAADTPERLTALSWSTWAYVTFSANVRRLWLAASDRSPAALHNVDHANHAREELHGLLRILDEQLRERPYVLGASFSLVDVALGNTITYATFCGVQVADHANVAAWLARFQARPSYRQIWGDAAV